MMQPRLRNLLAEAHDGHNFNSISTSHSSSIDDELFSAALTSDAV